MKNTFSAFVLISIIIFSSILLFPLKQAFAPGPLVAVVIISAASSTTAYVALQYAGKSFAAASASIPWKSIPVPKIDKDKEYVIMIYEIQQQQKIQEQLNKKAAKSLFELLKTSIQSSKGSVRIGADSSPTSCSKFVYRDYYVGSYVSRWDFHPPTKTTINNWCVDFDGDGSADRYYPSNIQGFILK